ncbi:hypothetical protein BROOK1789C_715 [Bathymodiolus brooksi thiotrophic gill symbiont]|nr:hypothetical protein BROOK1789C_715 [Bathymodiolus brooksi thiotrophic gill symbiont]CAC9578020.1 hypothetical protein [uncultured Gammaproteobacteria bacterium]CAC9965348.1 hypothetical protein [uncultured Gammaproteobacteria bacterium]
MKGLCINNHQESTSYLLGSFSSGTRQSFRRVNPALVLLEQSLKKSLIG